MMHQSIDDFAPRLLTWFDTYGRHDLPWQQHKTKSPDPYKVWLSEVMLQQTQVVTVIPYFIKFMQTFPTIQSLADAEWDTVAEHWAGLGYYARARNLHKGAKQLCEIIDSTGDYPQTVEGWEAISGVGPSTAGAIVAMGLHGYGVICDGNVKRVLTRWAGISEDINKAATTKQLWALAESLTPSENSGLFAQAMMDMGATVCHRTKPACLSASADLYQSNLACPLQADCIAYQQKKQTSYPVKTKKKAKSSKHSDARILINPLGEILWIQRPDTGIWGGLWSLPLRFVQRTQGKKVLSRLTDSQVYETEFTLAEQVIDKFLQSVQSNDLAYPEAVTPIKHTLTHFHWYLTPQTIKLSDSDYLQLCQQLDDTQVTNYQWRTYQYAQDKLALPSAMAKLLS